MRGKKAREIRKLFGVRHVRQARRISKGAVDLSALKAKGRERKRQQKGTRLPFER